MKHTVILGGGYAGSLAAARIARHGGNVTLIDPGDGLVERIRLHQVAAGDDVPLIPYDKLLGADVEHVRGWAAAIDRKRKRVVLANGEEVAYDTLVYAIGSTIPPREHAFTLTGRDAARELPDRLSVAKSVVIVGGGLTGIEMAAEIAERHPHVRITMVDGGTIGGFLSPRGNAHLRSVLRDVTMREHVRVDRLEEHKVILQNGEVLDGDLILWCASFALSPLAREAGLDVNSQGQIVVDAHLRSSDPSIYAIGDAAAVNIGHEQLRMGCVTAMPMGAYVADHLMDRTHEPFRFAFGIICISLGRHDGIIQFVHDDDTPRPGAITGRPAAWVKELVCRFTATSIRLEKFGIPYVWPKNALHPEALVA